MRIIEEFWDKIYEMSFTRRDGLNKSFSLMRNVRDHLCKLFIFKEDKDNVDLVHWYKELRGWILDIADNTNIKSGRPSLKTYIKEFEPFYTLEEVEGSVDGLIFLKYNILKKDVDIKKLHSDISLIMKDFFEKMTTSIVNPSNYDLVVKKYLPSVSKRYHEEVEAGRIKP